MFLCVCLNDNLPLNTSKYSTKTWVKPINNFDNVISGFQQNVTSKEIRFIDISNCHQCEYFLFHLIKTNKRWQTHCHGSHLRCSMIMLSCGEFDLIDQVPTNYPSSIKRRRCAYCYNYVNVISVSWSKVITFNSFQCTYIKY